MLKVIASTIVNLDSNVHYGGGTDVTAQLQEVLDKAPSCGGVHLLMDGAALVHGLKLHSNTIVECATPDCGFYMIDNGNRPILANADWDCDELKNENISVIGGTYNHNCANQAHSVPAEEFPIAPGKNANYFAKMHAIYLMEFYGVRNFRMQNVVLKNQRTYAFTLGNFENAHLENITMQLDELVHPSNQDGLHFFGPGRYLTMRDLKGCTGDDFINIAPDECDGVSSITDVLVDGVYFDGACQGIRMLSRGTGLLDRVTFRNITGTYRTFAFSIQPFYKGESFGKYGDIFIENVDLRQIETPIHYTPLSFLELGGDVENFTLKNVRFRKPDRNTLFLDLGRTFFYRPKELTEEEATRCRITDRDSLREDVFWMPENKRPCIKNFTLDDVIFETDARADDMDYISLKYNIENLMIRNIKLFRDDSSARGGAFMRMSEEGGIGKLFAENIYIEKIDTLLSGGAEHKIGLLALNQVIAKDVGKVLDCDCVRTECKIIEGIHEI